MGCIFDLVRNRKGWKEDPNLSLSDNIMWASVHFTHIFFEKYRVARHQNEDYDDMASECSLKVYEAAMRNIDKWDRDKFRLDQYMFGRAWSVVGQWLNSQMKKHSRELRSVPLGNGRMYDTEYDVGGDEIDATHHDTGTRYATFSSAPLVGTERTLSIEALEYLEYYDDCLYLGIDPEDPEDYCSAKTCTDSDIEAIRRILKKYSSPRTKKKSAVLGEVQTT